MCGVVGVLRSRADATDADLLATVERMQEGLRHRGPDDQGSWTDPAAGVALGHTRLAVVDLTPGGHQPMVSPSGRWVLSYNGEIYNHRSLAVQAAKAGVVAGGPSDTAALLAAIDAWGLDGTLERIDGMFAFALWDRETRTLHLVRDRLGEKPLAYGWHPEGLIFASEVDVIAGQPGFPTGIDPDALALMLTHGYVPAPRSIYQAVRKVPPGHVLTIRAGDGLSEMVLRAYWDLGSVARVGQEQPRAASTAVLADELERTLTGAVGRELEADVPVGALLSGGIDSTLVVALAQRTSSQPVRTFTIGFPESEFDESGYARSVAEYLGTEHEQWIITAEDARGVIPDLPGIYDEPFADSSQIPTVLVSRLARSRVTVAVTGDGGDELFGGYQRYGVHGLLAKGAAVVPFPVRSGLSRAVQGIPAERLDGVQRVLDPRGRHPHRYRRFGERAHRAAALLGRRDADQLTYASLMGHSAVTSRPLVPGSSIRSAFEAPELWPRDLDRLGRMRFADQSVYLPDDLLVKVDRAAMSVSLETRAPLLSREVVEFAWSLPGRALRRRGLGKIVLREVLRRHVPPSLWERPKMGFGVPMASWLRGPLRSWGEDLLTSQSARSDALVDAEVALEIWRQHQGGSRDNAGLLWALLSYRAWRLQAP